MSVLKTFTINGTTYNVTPIVPASSVTLLANAWTGEGDMHSQVVEIPGVTPRTKVDLQPTAEQLEEFYYKILAFSAENDEGVVTVYAIGDRPLGDHTIQITLTEVEGEGKIRGNTVGTPAPRSDWNQTDPRKADYIANKPNAVLYTSQNLTPEEKATARANIFPEQVNDILDYGKEFPLTFVQHGNIRVRAVVDKSLLTNGLCVVWNDPNYQIALNFKDADGKTVKDSGWKNSPVMIDSFTPAAEWATLRILVRKTDDSAIVPDDAVSAGIILRTVEYGNDLKQVLKDVEALSVDVDNLGNEVAEIKAKPDPVVKEKQSGITFVLHGGSNFIYPENTLLLLAGAKKYGYKICECDLRVTADGRFVLMHDATVDRTTNGTGNVADMTLEQIKALNIDLFPTGTTGEQWAGLTVPTLEEYLEDCIKYNITPMLEARDFTESQLDDLIAIIRKYNLEDVAIIESFYLATCTYLRSISRVQLAPLISFTAKNVDYCKALGNAYININATNENPSEEMMAYAIENGVEVIAWTINAPDRARALGQLGVKHIITDKLLYANKIENTYISEYRAIADNLDGATDNWGNLVYVTDMVRVKYKDLTRFRAEILYTEDKPTLTVGAVPYILQDKPNEWQTVDFTAPSDWCDVVFSMKDKAGVAYVKNASIAILKV